MFLISLITASGLSCGGGGGGITGFTMTLGLSTTTGFTACTSATQTSPRPLFTIICFGAASNSSAADGSRNRLRMKAISASATVAIGVLIVRLLRVGEHGCRAGQAWYGSGY